MKLWTLNVSWISHLPMPRRFPYSLWEACEFFKVPHIGLVKVERLAVNGLMTPPPNDRGKLRQEQSPSHLRHSGIRSPAGNWTRAALVRDRRANHSATWASRTNVWTVLLRELTVRQTLTLTGDHLPNSPYCIHIASYKLKGEFWLWSAVGAYRVNCDVIQ